MRNLILIVLLGAAAVASWLWSRPTAVEQPRHTAAGDEALGYYLHGARMFWTDGSGRVAYRIFADRLEERPNQERLFLERVQVEYHTPDQVPWVITSGSGSAPRDSSQLELDGGVELRSQPTDGRAPAHMTVEDLRVTRATSTAESDQRTQISVGNWHLDGMGLLMNLKDDRMELKSDVHGKFTP